jgi:hypothetical protein
VLVNRLSARNMHAGLLCEAGQDISEENVPPEIADSYPGIADFGPRFHWTELKVRTQPVSHNNPPDLRPLRKNEQARVLGGGSSINVHRLGVVHTRNQIATRVIAKLLDGPAALRRLLIDRYAVEGFRFDEVMRDDDKLEAFIRQAAIGVWHASCSCRMGSADDPIAVTDPAGRVRGMPGLRVVDASLFPVEPCANTNIPTLMAAEKIADAILAGG